jgi:hypothetical protein
MINLTDNITFNEVRKYYSWPIGESKNTLYSVLQNFVWKFIRELQQRPFEKAVKKE